MAAHSSGGRAGRRVRTLSGGIGRESRSSRCNLPCSSRRRKASRACVNTVRITKSTLARRRRRRVWWYAGVGKGRFGNWRRFPDIARPRETAVATTPPFLMLAPPARTPPPPPPASRATVSPTLHLRRCVRRMNSWHPACNSALLNHSISRKPCHKPRFPESARPVRDF